MIRKIREAQEEQEGFTLIELLVVVIIIGILAAIAIPVFLSQRERAELRALEASVNAAVVQVQTDYTTTGVWQDAVDDVVGTQGNVTIAVGSGSTPADFCIQGTIASGAVRSQTLTEGSGLSAMAEAAC